MNYIKQLQETIEGHQDHIDNQTAELSLLENELKDTLTPSITVMKQSQLILEMLMLNNEFMRKNHKSTKGLESKQRLLELLDLNTKLNGITDQNATLKTMNRNLLGENQKLHTMVAKLNQSIDKYNSATNF